MIKKTNIKAIIATLVSGFTLTTLSGCDIHIDEGVKDVIDISVSDNGDINITPKETNINTEVVTTTVASTVKPSTTTTTAVTTKEPTTTTKKTTTSTTTSTTTTTNTTTTSTTTSTTTTLPQTTTRTTCGLEALYPSIRPNTYTRAYECNKWVEEGIYEYVVQEGDTIFNLAPRFNLTREELLEKNDRELNDPIIANQTVLKVPAKLVKYYVNETTRFDEVARIVGQHPDELRKTTRTPGHEYDNNEYIKGGTEIVVKALFYDEVTYDNLYGTETIITPSIILQDVAKFEFASGWAGASTNVLVMYEYYVKDTKFNRVSWIETLGGGSTYYETLVANDVKDIGKIDDIPVAYLQNNYKVDVNIGDQGYPGTDVFEGYTPHANDLGVLVTFNNSHYDLIGARTIEMVKTYK